MDRVEPGGAASRGRTDVTFEFGPGDIKPGYQLPALTAVVRKWTENLI